MPFTGLAEDRLAIRELLETYADAVTRCDAAGWYAVFKSRPSFRNIHRQRGPKGC